MYKYDCSKTNPNGLHQRRVDTNTTMVHGRVRYASFGELFLSRLKRAFLFLFYDCVNGSTNFGAKRLFPRFISPDLKEGYAVMHRCSSLHKPETDYWVLTCILYEGSWRIINATSITEFGFVRSKKKVVNDIKRMISQGPCDIHSNTGSEYR